MLQSSGGVHNVVKCLSIFKYSNSQYNKTYFRKCHRFKNVAQTYVYSYDKC